MIVAALYLLVALCVGTITVPVMMRFMDAEPDDLVFAVALGVVVGLVWPLTLPLIVFGGAIWVATRTLAGFIRQERS